MTEAPFRFVWEGKFRNGQVGKGKRGSLTVAVGLTLATYANADGTSIHPSIETVADGLGIDRSGVGAAVRRLVEEGWLEVTRQRDLSRGWLVTHYRLTLPAPLRPKHGARAPEHVAPAPHAWSAGATSMGRGHHTTSTATTSGTPSFTNTARPTQAEPVPPAAVSSGEVSERELEAAVASVWFEIGLRERIANLGEGESLSALDQAYIARTAPPFD